MKRGIALFDFDGTITMRDTLLEFIKYTEGNARFYKGFVTNTASLIALKLGLISNQEAKEKILQYFFQGLPLKDFEEKCKAFTANALPALIRKEAMLEIERLKKQQFIIVVVSASPQNWISEWANTNGVELIASVLEVKDGKLTGRIKGNNCHGEEKVRRITELFRLQDYLDIYAYGDSKGDRPMLALANKSFYKPFRNN